MATISLSLPFQFKSEKANPGRLNINLLLFVQSAFLHRFFIFFYIHSSIWKALIRECGSHINADILQERRMAPLNGSKD
jgi:hypothetical protein